MRYTEEKYQAFLEELIQRIFQEYTQIGVVTERWKSSFSVLRPDFGQKKAPLRVQRQRRRSHNKN